MFFLIYNMTKWSAFLFLFLALLHSKNSWVVLTQLWVKYGLTQPLG